MSEQPLDPVVPYEVSRLRDQIVSIKNTLSQAIANSGHPRLKEKIFVKVFLPFFVGDVANQVFDVNLYMWVNAVAGNAHNPVDIIDEAGNYLYTVPAVMAQEAIVPISQRPRDEMGREIKTSSLGEIMHRAEALAKQHPIQGQNFLFQVLTEKAKIIQVPPNVIDNLVAWNGIFQRYGLPPIVEVQKSNMNSNSSQGPEQYDLQPL